VQFGLSNGDKGRYASPQIQQDVQFDAGFGFSKARSRKEGQAQINGTGIQDIDGFVELNSEVFLDVYRGHPIISLSSPF
jgi:hypothetical protein